MARNTWPTRVVVNQDGGPLLSRISIPAKVKGSALAHTIETGSGSIIPLDRVVCFSGGLRNSRGDVWVEGDSLSIGGVQCKALGVDPARKRLTIDRSLQWEKGAPVFYKFMGEKPGTCASE